MFAGYAKGFGKPSTSFQERQIQLICKMCEVMKYFLRQLLTSFMHDHSQDVVLVSYSSDCTPTKFRKRIRTCTDNLTINRSARTCGEFLVQRMFALTADGKKRAFFPEPYRLQDKTAWSCFSAWLQLHLDCRGCGHDGIAIFHFCYDRGILEPLFRCQAKYLRGKYEFDKQERGEVAAFERWCRTLILKTECLNHGAHNSLCWAFRQWIWDPTTTKKLFICIESLRQGYSELVRHLPKWIGSVLRFEDAESDHFLEMWNLFGVHPELASLLCDLQVRFEDNCIKIAARWQHHPDLQNILFTAFLGVWSWRRFSDSRWVTFGLSCRALLGALYLGLTSYLQFLSMHPGVSLYNLRGFAKFFSKNVKEVVGIVGVSSFVSDGVLTLLMEDERVIRALPSIDQAIQEELLYIESLSDSVLRVIAGCCEYSLPRLRHAVTHSAWVQAGFFNERVNSAREPPWSICSERDGLINLLMGPRPTEPTLMKIYDLGKLGTPHKQLDDVVALMRNVPWSIKTAEQGHTHATRIARYHPDLSSNVLAARSYICSIKPLLHRDPEQAGMEQLRQRLQRLDDRRPNHITGRQVYLKELQGEVRQARSRGRDLPSNISSIVMSGHGRSWNKLSVEKRNEYEEKALAEREAAMDRICEERSEIIGKIKELEAKRQDCSESPQSLRLLMSDCRLSPAQHNDLDRALQDESWTWGKISSLREQADRAIGPPSAEMRAAIEMQEAPSQSIGHPKPPWLSFVCKERDDLKNAVFRFLSPEGPFFYKLLYAKQNPLIVCFTPIAEATPLEGNSSSSSFMCDTVMWQRTFKTQVPQFVFSPGSTIDCEWQMDVLVDVWFGRGGTLYSDGLWLPWESLRTVPDAVSSEVSSSPKDEGTAAEVNDLEDCPWLLELFGPESQYWSPEAIETFTKPSSTSTVGLAATDVDSALEDLWARRVDLQGELARQGDHFSWNVRGGTWTATHKGMAYDSYRAFARNGAPQEWCSKVRLLKAATFAVQLYGDDGGLNLAIWWVEKMSHLYSFSCDNLSADEWRQVADKHKEPDDIANLYATGGPKVKARINEIRNMIPRLQRSSLINVLLAKKQKNLYIYIHIYVSMYVCISNLCTIWGVGKGGGRGRGSPVGMY